MVRNRWLSRGLIATLLTVGLLFSPTVDPVAAQQSAGKHDKEQGVLPLKPERKIEFTTDEGTWISLDLSPDGKTIVFDLLGNMYTLPIEGGQSNLISGGLAFDKQPRFSPDGTKIVFVSDRSGDNNLWIANADGSNPWQLTKEELTVFTSPVWTSSGDHIIVSRRKPYTGTSLHELWLYDVKGGSGVQITKGKTERNAPTDSYDDALGVAVSLDGRYLYYAHKRGFHDRDYPVSAFPLWQIARRDRETGVEETITQEPGSAMRPALSPDGTHLVYGTRFDSNTGLRVRDLKTGRTRWLKYPVDRDLQERYNDTRDLLPGYTFTPDGKSLIAAYGGKIHHVNIETGEDAVIPFVTNVSKGLGPSLDSPTRMESGPVRARLIQHPGTAPDGKRIAFSAFAHLYFIDLPDAKAKRVTSGGDWEFEPAWSPDGKWLAYVTWTGQGGDLWKVRSDGLGSPQRLTRVSEYYSDPVWAPDGSRIFLFRAPWQDRLELQVELARFYAMPNQDLVWVSAEGGDEHVVASANRAGHLHFSRDEHRIYFTVPGTTPSSDLVSLRLDGTDRRIDLRIAGKNTWEYPLTTNTEIVLSPDGRMALALFRHQLYVLRVPPAVGAPSPTIDLSSPSVAVSKLTDLGADCVGWSDKGTTITWSLGSTLFRRALRSVSFKTATEKGEAEDSASVRRDRAQEGLGADDAGVQGEEGSSSTKAFPVIVEQPRYWPKGTIVLRGARVVTMRGDQVLSNADLVITGNRIVAVGNRGSLSIPPKSKVLDVSGTTIIPGFVDTHDHWNRIRRDVLQKQNWEFLTNLAYGVTSGRDPQSTTNDIFAYRDLEETGEILAPRLFSTGPGIFPDTDLQSFQDALNVVMRYKEYYKTNTIKEYKVGDRRKRQWFVEACKKLQVMPTTEGASNVELDLTQFIDGYIGNEHNFPIVPLYKDVIELVAQSHSFYNPTLLETFGGPPGWIYFIQTTNPYDDPKVRRFYPHGYLELVTRRGSGWARRDEYDFKQVAEATAKIIHAGGRVSVGSHGNFGGLSFQWALWSLADGGLTPLEALRIATLGGAESIGYGQDLGSIEQGKLADLIVLNKDPSLDIHNTAAIRYVMKNGQLFEGETLNEIWPEQKALAPLWWWSDRP